jgi:myosin-1
VLFKQFGDSQILFADEVTKMNRSGGADTRVVIVTEANIYKCDPKNYKVKKYDGSVKGGVPVGEISAVSLSPLPDNFVVVHTKEGMRDIVVGVGAPGVDKLSEFVTILAGLYKSITHNPLPVTFAARCVSRVLPLYLR